MSPVFILRNHLWSLMRCNLFDPVASHKLEIFRLGHELRMPKSGSDMLDQPLTGQEDGNHMASKDFVAPFDGQDTLVGLEEEDSTALFDSQNTVIDMTIGQEILSSDSRFDIAADSSDPAIFSDDGTLCDADFTTEDLFGDEVDIGVESCPKNDVLLADEFCMTEDHMDPEDLFWQDMGLNKDIKEASRAEVDLFDDCRRFSEVVPPHNAGYDHGRPPENEAKYLLDFEDPRNDVNMPDGNLFSEDHHESLSDDTVLDSSNEPWYEELLPI